MADKPDVDQLARQYLDLWQEHLSDLAGDGEVAETVAKSIELMNGSAAAFARMAEQNLRQAGGLEDDEAGGSTVAKSSGAAPAGAAHRDTDDVVDRLTGRIDQLEQRLAKLETWHKNQNKRPRR